MNIKLDIMKDILNVLHKIIENLYFIYVYMRMNAIVTQLR